MLRLYKFLSAAWPVRAFQHNRPEADVVPLWDVVRRLLRDEVGFLYSRRVSRHTPVLHEANFRYFGVALTQPRRPKNTRVV